MRTAPKKMHKICNSKTMQFALQLMLWKRSGQCESWPTLSCTARTSQLQTLSATYVQLVLCGHVSYIINYIFQPQIVPKFMLWKTSKHELQPILSCTICIPQISKSSLELACNFCLQKGASTFYLKWHKTCRNLQLAQHTYCATTHTLKKVAKYWFCNSGFQDPSSGSWNYWESLDESFAPFWPQEGDCFWTLAR